MKIERDERRFDFHDIGLAIKRAREASGMTQEQLAYIVDRSPRTIMYNENDGQHPSLNTFYQLVTMFDISVSGVMLVAPVTMPAALAITLWDTSKTAMTILNVLDRIRMAQVVLNTHL